MYLIVHHTLHYIYFILSHIYMYTVCKYNVYIQCVYTMCIYNVYIQCVYTVYIYIYYIIVYIIYYKYSVTSPINFIQIYASMSFCKGKTQEKSSGLKSYIVNMPIRYSISPQYIWLGYIIYTNYIWYIIYILIILYKTKWIIRMEYMSG